MQDYSEDGGTGMTHVFNGSKMLLNLPSEIVLPTAHIHGRIFFVDELLPEHTSSPNSFLCEIGGIRTYHGAFSRQGTLCLGPRCIPN